MKTGKSEKIVVTLNDILTDELSAIHQYTVNSTMCEVWGYGKQHGVVMQRAIVEMKHAEALIKRILFLGGEPIVSRLSAINIGSAVDAQIKFDLEAERAAIAKYNDAIAAAREAGDNGTRDLLEHNVSDEEEHALYLESQLTQIAQMGFDNFLSTLV